MTSTHPGRPGAAPDGAPAGRLRGPADPVLALMHRHHDLCARAVDPLEIAAALEAHGITDRVAARFRHRDVFTLAEELYARVPRDHTPDCPGRDGTGACPDAPVRPRGVALHLLPAAVCAVAIALTRLLGPAAAAWTGAAALAALALTARAAVRGGPLRGSGTRGAGLAVLWLLAFALYGPWAAGALLAGSAGGAPGGLLDPVAAAGFLARAAAIGPAAWGARWFARRVRERLRDTRGLAAFRAGVRRPLAALFALFGAGLLALAAGAWELLGGPALPGAAAATGLAGGAALGLLLFAAQLLTVHGNGTAAARALGAVCAAQAAVLAWAAAAGPDSALRALTRAAGPAAVQAATCGAGAIVLAVCAVPLLGRAAAHAARPVPPPYDPAYAAALFTAPSAGGPAAPVR